MILVQRVSVIMAIKDGAFVGTHISRYIRVHKYLEFEQQVTRVTVILYMCKLGLSVLSVQVSD